MVGSYHKHSILMQWTFHQIIIILHVTPLYKWNTYNIMASNQNENVLVNLVSSDSIVCILSLVQIVKR